MIWSGWCHHQPFLFALIINTNRNSTTENTVILAKKCAENLQDKILRITFVSEFEESLRKQRNPTNETNFSQHGKLLPGMFQHFQVGFQW